MPAFRILNLGILEMDKEPILCVRSGDGLLLQDDTKVDKSTQQQPQTSMEGLRTHKEQIISVNTMGI